MTIKRTAGAQQTNKQKKYATKPTKINLKSKKIFIRSKIREHWPGYQIRLQSLVFYFSLNVVFVAVVVCLFICLPRYCVTIVILMSLVL